MDLVQIQQLQCKKDIKKGKSSEKDELIFNIVNIAKKYGIDVPNYKKIAKYFGYSKSSMMFTQRKKLM